MSGDRGLTLPCSDCSSLGMFEVGGGRKEITREAPHGTPYFGPEMEAPHVFSSPGVTQLKRASIVAAPDAAAYEVVPCSERALRTAWASFLDPLCITARSRISPTLSIPLMRSHVQPALPRYHPQSSPVLDLKRDVCSSSSISPNLSSLPIFSSPETVHYRIIQP
jgi:hypothetical protein